MINRSTWTTSNNTTYVDRDGMIQLAKDRFDIQRYQSAEGEDVVVVNDYYNYDSSLISKVVIQAHKNPYNENREDRKVFFDYETEVKRGSYVIWEDKWWLTLTKVEGNHAYRHATISECNNVLKWYDKFGKLHSFPCIFYPQSKANSFDFNQSINVVNALCKIEVQYNEYTNEIKSSDRFILNGLAYEVTSVAKHKMNDCFDANSVSTITLDLSVSVTQADDDLINNIANVNKYKYSLSINEEDFSCQPNTSGTLTSTITLNGNIVDLPVTWKSSDESIVKIYDNGYYETLASGNAMITCHIQGNEECLDSINIVVDAVLPDVVSIKFSPNVTKILQGKTQSYEVSKYVNESKTTTVLTVEDISTIGSGYYEFAITGNNTFTVKNIKLNSNGKVRVKATDSYGNSEILEITLGGVW